MFSDPDQNDDDSDDHEQFDKGKTSTQTDAVRTHHIVFSCKCSTTAFETMFDSVAIEPQTGMAPAMVPCASVCSSIHETAAPDGASAIADEVSVTRPLAISIIALQ